MNEEELTLALNKHYRFVLDLDESYTLKYTKSELKWEEFKDQVSNNVEVLKNQTNGFWSDGLLTPWQELNDAIAELPKSLAECENNNSGSIDLDKGFLDGTPLKRLSSKTDNIDEYKILYFTISSISSLDECFPEFLAFINWASERCREQGTTCDSELVIRKYVETIKDPSVLYKGLSSDTPVSMLPNLWALKHELSSETSLQAESRDLLNASKLQLKEAIKHLALSDQQFRLHHGELTTEMETFRGDMEDWRSAEEEKISELERIYREKLALAEPKKVWDDTAARHRRYSLYWSMGAVVTASITLIAGSLAVRWLYTANLPDVPLLSKSFLAIAIITFSVYMIRVFIKLAISNNHLSAAYTQKSAMTYFYLSLMEKDEKPGDDERALIYNSLFSSVDTGLVKPNDNADIEKILAVLLRRA